MLLLLHEQDKMAPDWLHQEVNNNNIRLSSEAILSPILGEVGKSVSVLLLPFSRLQDGLPKGLTRCSSSNGILRLHGVLMRTTLKYQKYLSPG
uniref:Uncharacterized protein n=1 Tax=Neovison vison TaxID=452646 RepID=A0A8C7A480_NEOVI